METHPNSSASRICNRTSAVKVFATLTFLAGVVCAGYSKLTAISNSAGSQEKHLVGIRIQAGPADRELTLMFSVSPATRVPPIVRWPGTASRRAKKLEVLSDSAGPYSARVGDIQNVDNGQVLVELSDAQNGLHELHSADFAVREIATNRPSSSPSRDGHFVVHTIPTGISQGSRLLISSGELPIDALPTGVSSGAVVGAYFLDSIPSLVKMEGWRLAIATVPADGKMALFYLPKGGATWKPLETNLVEGHPLLDAAIAGPGTYLLVKGAK